MPDKPKPPNVPDEEVRVTPPIGIIVIPVNIDISTVLKVLDAAANLQNIDQYKQLQPALQKAVSDLKTYLTRQDAQISSLQNQLTSAQTQITTLQNSNTDLTNQVAALNAQVVQLKAQLASQPQKALPLHVAQSFKNAMDQIQSDARAAGGPQTTITNMQIAVKALLSVQDGVAPNTKDAVLVFPDPSSPPDPNLLSTLTVSFGAIPNLKAANRIPAPQASSVGATAAPFGPAGAASTAASSTPAAQPSSPAAAPVEPPKAEPHRSKVAKTPEPEKSPGRNKQRAVRGPGKK